MQTPVVASLKTPRPATCSPGRTDEWCASATTVRAAWWLSVMESVCGRVQS